MPSRLLASLIVLLLCSCSTATPGGPAPTAATTAPAGRAYEGPALPGLATEQAWTLPLGSIRDAVAVGKSFAVLGRAADIFALQVIDAATGRELKSIPIEDEDATLRADTDHGKPVAVVRHRRQLAASGLTAESSQVSDLVIDETGSEVWRSPEDGDGRQGTFFIGGYAAQGEADGAGLSNVSKLSTLAGQQAVALPIGAEEENSLLGVIKDKAVYWPKGMLLDEEAAVVHGFDLSKGGSLAWRLPRDVQARTIVGDFLLTWQSDGMSSTHSLYDLMSGERVGGFEVSNSVGVRCATSAFDADSDAVLCDEPLTLIDSRTGKLLVPTVENQREASVESAFGGIAYLKVKQEQGAEPLYLALDDRTGKVLGDNLPAAPLAVSTDDYALIWHKLHAFGFKRTA
ncbi:hypothetical protein ACIBQ6_12300 [Nonomuraea sp. NPDC049655]|uniref:hypothetical protein n=1 Tax=Nonomuraea sp. NPDC049655 TaxID=3364355 RepID=UPI00379360FF